MASSFIKYQNNLKDIWETKTWLQTTMLIHKDPNTLAGLICAWISSKTKHILVVAFASRMNSRQNCYLSNNNLSFCNLLYPSFLWGLLYQPHPSFSRILLWHLSISFLFLVILAPSVTLPESYSLKISTHCSSRQTFINLLDYFMLIIMDYIAPL